MMFVAGNRNSAKYIEVLDTNLWPVAMHLAENNGTSKTTRSRFTNIESTQTEN